MTTTHGAAAALAASFPASCFGRKINPYRLSPRGRCLVLIADGNPSWHKDLLLGHRLR